VTLEIAAHACAAIRPFPYKQNDRKINKRPQGSKWKREEKTIQYRFRTLLRVIVPMLSCMFFPVSHTGTARGVVLFQFSLFQPLQR
jgi:hypothetical protein